MYQLVSLQRKLPPKTQRKFNSYVEARVAIRSLMRKLGLWRGRQHPTVYTMNRCGFGIVKVS